MDLETITTSVNIVFHSAATVRFNDDLKEAGLLNALATKILLDLCLRIANLKVRFNNFFEELLYFIKF